MVSVDPAGIALPLARRNGVPVSGAVTSPTVENCGDEIDTSPIFSMATFNCSSATGHVCSTVMSPRLYSSWNPTWTDVTPAANGPVTVTTSPSTVALGDDP